MNEMAAAPDIFIGFGSNLGDSLEICRQAIAMLASNRQLEVSRVSSFYRTEPEGYKDQPWFINGVLQCRSQLEPLALLAVLRAIENDLGRMRKIRWGPRTLDLDILSFGDLLVDLPELVIPHPRLHERRFVLEPLREIAPHWRHPVLQVSVEELLNKLAANSGNEVLKVAAQ